MNLTNVFTLNVDKGVPVPSRSLVSKVDWTTWELNDSALIQSKKRVMTLRSGKEYLMKNGLTDRKFITRSEGTMTRIWLVQIDN